jgi:hypothetical protein
LGVVGPGAGVVVVVEGGFGLGWVVRVPVPVVGGRVVLVVVVVAGAVVPTVNVQASLST